VRRGAPRHGEHGREIAREAGLSEAEIEGLLAGRVLLPPAS
jgi:crotonobetainyl-CoA:carnitine CoA-transferase CaiB-like acyl-CoA transferase